MNAVKKSAYLDQNVLVYIVDHADTEFFQVLDKYTVVYSDETLCEIRRYDEVDGLKYIQVLENLDAKYMVAGLFRKDFPQLKPNFVDKPPIEIYRNYCYLNKDKNEVSENLAEFSHKFYGGKRDKSFKDIFSKGESNLSDIFDNLLNDMKDLSMGTEYFSSVFEILKEENIKVNSKILKNLNGSIENESEYDAVNDFRSSFSLSSNELNNITGNNVAFKIWKTVIEKNNKITDSISIEQFFGIDVDSVYGLDEISISEKIIRMYNMLNFIGYYPDQKLHLDGKFISSTSDSTHAVMGAHADVLFTIDKRFARKIEAIYEYLNIKVEVINPLKILKAV
ncbi:MAG: hypothetical protein OEY52_10530 [Gammaproteobacteria bacterium]|nr:hypothetical protein [Gammaproteobacteria bacterium]